MALANCVKCKKIFNRVSSPICDDCHKKEEETYEKVYQYLKENPDITVPELAKATEVSEKKIFKYFRDGRFIELTGDKAYLNCQQCGKPINSGSHCKECKIKMSKNINSAFGTNHSYKDLVNIGKEKEKRVTIMDDRKK